MTCNSCGRSTRRGWTGGVSGGKTAHCLVCWTNRIMATFVWPPKQRGSLPRGRAG